MAIQSFSFTGNAQSSGAIRAKDNNLIAFSLDFGGGTATVDLERRVAGGDWTVLEQFSADTEKNVEAVSVQCAFRCTTSAFSSGPIAMNMVTPG